MNTRRLLAAAVWGVLAAHVAAADEDAAATNAHARNVRQVEQQFETNRLRCAGNPDLLALPGLLADRRARRVQIMAEGTGMRADDPVEFFLIGFDSGHDYEALALSFAKPSAVHTALQFVGMQPGRPVAAEALQFHPKGERVAVTFARPGKPPIRAERLVVSSRTHGPLPCTGLVFTGSRLTDPPDGKGPRVYAADVSDPFSIASNYNEPGTVLDVPRQAPQGDVYRLQTPNPDFLFAKGDLIEVELRPELTNGAKRIADLSLNAAALPGTAGTNLQEVAFRLEGDAGRLTVTGGLNAVLAAFVSLNQQARDPFVSLRFDAGLPLGTLHDLCGLLATIDNEQGIRIEPPPEGQLYYKAFIPDETYRDREQRIAQPWELHLQSGIAGPTGTLIQIEQVWREDRVRPDLKMSRVSVAGPTDLRRELDARGPGLRVILAYAPPRMPFGQLMAFIKPALTTHPTVHVLLDESPP
jgi:hypothetical protein